jgi:hypothetical protein
MSRRFIALLIVSCIPLAKEHRCCAASETEINDLIAKLVSPNKAPGKVDYLAEAEPPDFDKAAQHRVYIAWKQLYDIGLPAFPHLLRNVGDKRYSFTRLPGGGSTDMNWSVGRACLDIVRCHLQPYGEIAESDLGTKESHPPRPNYIAHYRLREPKAAIEWWEKRKDKSLNDLQFEALVWVIVQEAATPGKYSAKETDYLNDIAAKLRKSSAPLEPGWPFER